MSAAAAEAASWRTAAPCSPRDHRVCASRIAAKASLCPRSARTRGALPVTFAAASHSPASGASAFIRSGKSASSAMRATSRLPIERMKRPSAKRVAISAPASSRAARRNLRSGGSRRASSSAARRSRGCGGKGGVLSPSRPAASFSAAARSRVRWSSTSFRSRQCQAWTPSAPAAPRMHRSSSSARRFMRACFTLAHAVRLPVRVRAARSARGTHPVRRGAVIFRRARIRRENFRPAGLDSTSLLV